MLPRRQETSPRLRQREREREREMWRGQDNSFLTLVEITWISDVNEISRHQDGLSTRALTILQ